MALAATEPRVEGRVLLLFDASPGSLLALQSALRAAGSLRPLEAIYIEEIDWLRSAAFAFSAEVGALSGALRRHAPADLEQRLSRRRERVRRALLDALKPSADPLANCRLSVRRGRLLDEVLALAAPEDLLVVGRVGYSSCVGRELGSLAFELAHRAHGPVLLSAGQAAGADRIGARVAVLLDQASDVSSLLESAAERARQHSAGLLVLVSPRACREAELAQCLAGLQVPLQRHYLPEHPDPDGWMLARILAEAGVGELLVSRRGRLFSRPDTAKVLARIPCSVSVLP